MIDCSKVVGHQCSTNPCPGESNPAICDHLARLAGWRSLSTDEQIGKLEASRLTIDPLVRDRVNACPHRGPVLPISLQDDCGCRGKELSECRMGRGILPGRVTLRDCLKCQEPTDRGELREQIDSGGTPSPERHRDCT